MADRKDIVEGLGDLMERSLDLMVRFAEYAEAMEKRITELEGKSTLKPPPPPIKSVRGAIVDELKELFKKRQERLSDGESKDKI